MCKVLEDICIQERYLAKEEGRKETTVEFVLRMITSGRYALKEIADISGLSLDEVKKLQAKQGL